MSKKKERKSTACQWIVCLLEKFILQISCNYFQMDKQADTEILKMNVKEPMSGKEPVSGELPPILQAVFKRFSTTRSMLWGKFT